MDADVRERGSRQAKESREEGKHETTDNKPAETCNDVESINTPFPLRRFDSASAQKCIG